jgi:hypothetical protein
MGMDEYSWFDAYPEFEAFPYQEYSQVYFDRAHRVLAGRQLGHTPLGTAFHLS